MAAEGQLLDQLVGQAVQQEGLGPGLEANGLGDRWQVPVLAEGQPVQEEL